MIVRLTAKNQRELFDDDLRRLRTGRRLHYSIGQHISLLIDRMAAVEAASGIEARQGGNGEAGAVHESPSDAPNNSPNNPS